MSSGPLPVNHGVDLQADCRPDLVEDSGAWTLLLAAAAALEPNVLFGALYGIRAVGARLVPTGTGWRIDRPDGVGLVEWQSLRERWLLPHRRALVSLLEGQLYQSQSTQD